MKRKSERDKKLVDDARFMRWWKAWHREEREAVLAGPPASRTWSTPAVIR